MISIVVGNTCKKRGSVDELKEGVMARRFLACHPFEHKRSLPISNIRGIMPTPSRRSAFVPHLHRGRRIRPANVKFTC